MRYRINWRFILVFTAVTAVSLVAVHFVHRYQVRRQVGIFLDQADLARDAQPRDTQREIDYLRRYVAVRGDDIDARERLGKLVCESAKTGKERLDGYFIVEDVLRRAPERSELRRFAIDFAMKPEVRLYPQALANIETLLEKHPNDGELELLAARCLVGKKEYEKAAGKGGLYEKAVEHRPDLAEAYVERAAILRSQLQKFKEADESVAAMLEPEANRKNFRTYILTAAYWRLFWALRQNASESANAVVVAQEAAYWGREGAPKKKDPKDTRLPPNPTVVDAFALAVEEAKRLAPDERDVILADADVLRFRGYEYARRGEAQQAEARYEEARKRLQTGVAKYPKDPAVYLALAALEAETKQEKEAVAVVNRGLEALPENLALVIALLDYQIRAKDAKGARETLDRLTKKGLAPAQAELQRGRILMLEEQWIEASRELELARKDSEDPDLTRQAYLFLGRCYEQRGLHDRRLEAFRQATPADTTDRLWVPAMLGRAQAHLALGQSKEALALFDQLRGRDLDTWGAIARLEMAAELRKPVQDWSKTEAALANAEFPFRLLLAAQLALQGETAAAREQLAELRTQRPKYTDARILRADLTHLRGNPAEARKQLEALKADNPKDASVWVALAIQDLREGKPEQALATLDAAVKEAGDSPTLRLARGRIWVIAAREAEKTPAKTPAKAPDAAARQELERKLESLVADADKFKPAEQRTLVRGVAELAAAADVRTLAARLWDRAAQLQPYDLGVHQARFDLAMRAGDEEKLKAVQNDIKQVDGENGASTRFARALYLIWRAQNKDDKSELGAKEKKLALDEAGKKLADLERERNSARVAFAQAMVHDLNRERSPALAKYRQAVELGDKSPTTIRRLAELLRLEGKIDEAAALVDKLKDTLTDARGLQLVADLAVLASDRDPKKAEEAADKVVPEGSTDPADYIHQGNLYVALQVWEKAEAAFRKAAALRPEKAEGWLVLIQYLAGSKRREEAEKTIEEAQGKVDKAEQNLFLGAAYGVVGKLDKAAEAYKQARAERPNDLRTVRAEATFLFQAGRLAEAREAYKRVMALPGASAEEKEAARQMIGVSLAADRDYATSRKALEELGLLAGGQLRPLTGNETRAEKQARIVVLALQRDRASRLEAIRMLEAERDLGPSDQFLLAQLHNGAGNRNQVRVVMSGLLKNNDRSPLYVGFFAGWLIRVGDTQEAEKWVDQMAKLQPDSLLTAELQARLAAAKGDAAAARKAIVPRADKPDAPVLTIARVCEAIKLYDDAEALYKRVVEKVKDKQPQAPLLVAEFYARRGRVADALRVCDESRKVAPPEVVGAVAIAALYEAAAPTAAQMDQVAGWLDEASRKAAGAPKAALIQLLASVRNLQGNYDASARLYEEALVANPRDALAMNNLAFLISAKEGKHAEALKLLERAKQARGPLHELLDTEALVRLNMFLSAKEKDPKQIAEVRRLLEYVTAEAPSGTGFFHLAQVELAAHESKLEDRKLEARRAWQQAEELGVKAADLHPLERPEFVRVSKELK